MANSGYRWPQGRVTINLAPADVKKEGPSFDLPIAVAMIAAEEEIDLTRLAEDCILVGELALDGAVRPVRGCLAIASGAPRWRRRRLFVPAANVREAAFVEGVDVYGVSNLREVFEFLRGGPDAPKLLPRREDARAFFATHQEHEADFSEVKGQPHARRAMEIAAAGAHNLLMIGPPGSGKSMMAKRIPSIMPPLTLDEALETTKIHSVAGKLNSGDGLVAVPPYSAPHATISDPGLLGGSGNPTPGEISLCHHGVLFLDELPEFRRSALESLRQPLEDSKITISRAAGTVPFPAAFNMIGAMNPCKCGYYGDTRRACKCSPLDVQRYRQRISGPLLDRIDLHVEVPSIKYEHLTDQSPAESSAAIRARVVAAREVQRGRAGKNNSRLTPRQIRTYCKLDETGSELLKMATSELNLSARAYDRVLKVSRTIADLDNASESIQPHHLAEAVQYRTLDRGG